MKKAVIMLNLMLTLAAAGCAEEYPDIHSAAFDGALLGEHIYIDGIDVSGMSPVAAAAAVDEMRASMLERENIAIIAGDDSISIPLDRFSVSYDTEQVVMRALGLKRHWLQSGGARELSTEPTVEREQLLSDLRLLCAELEYPPVDASAVYDAAGKDFTFTADVPGRRLDYDGLAESAAALLEEGRSGWINAEGIMIPAACTLDMAMADNTLIAEFTTSFSGKTYSMPNRVFNIAKAAGLIDGVRIEPGEEFDMNHALGDRNDENGWRTATGIRDGAYVQEYGGGVCQVSTTLYNALLMADLEITERHHHSWPLGYIDIGRDATISTGGPNLKFRNDSSAAITLSAGVDEENETTTVRIFGRALPDGMRIELTSRRTATLERPGTEEKVDPELPYGERKIIREERRGKMAETYKLYYDSSGELIERELVSEDKYRSIKGLIHVSPEQAGS